MKYDAIEKLAHKFVSHLEPFRRNYDYGEGLFSNLDKYDSIEEFLKKRKKRKSKDSSHQQNALLKSSGDLINLFPTKKPENIDSTCEMCGVGELIHDDELDLWICQECNYEFEDEPHRPEYDSFNHPGYLELKNEHPWIPYAQAKYYVEAYTDSGGGIDQTFIDPFEAKRFADRLKELGFDRVVVRPISKIKETQDEIMESLYDE